ncbi:MAG: 50S ribosomal protein L21 [Alphaproteobacteria bacterium GM202ARS2]|nr:50S ribosomal protein L21 [Alphaproteobacteria bacterium GM202ARS2]
MFAVVETSGRQYKVSEQDHFVVDKVDAEVGARLVLAPVVMMGDASGGEALVGKALAKACVSVRVIEHRRLPKLIVFKKKRRQNYRRRRGFRAECTVLQVEGIHKQGLGGKDGS